MSGLKREDEYRLKELTQLAEEIGRSALSDDDHLNLLLLEDRYNKFLDEGIRKLREAASPRSPKGGSGGGIRGLFGRSSSISSKAPVNNNSGDLTAAAGAASESPVADDLDSSQRRLDGSPVSAGASLLVAPPQSSGKLWTWAFDYLIVGGIPYASPTTDTPGHLSDLHEQCFQRRSAIAAVVSCLDVEEPVPNGFAVAKDWEVQLSTNTFFHVTCIPAGAPPAGESEGAATSPTSNVEAAPVVNQAFEELISVCQNVQKLCDVDPGAATRRKASETNSIRHRLSIVARPQGRKKVVYVHCKTGLTRSWVFLMIFVIFTYGKTFEEADLYLRGLRAFDPKPHQIDFVKRFVTYLESPRASAVNDDEEKYVRILAEVLSLAPKYRSKLLQDLEKLT